MKFDYNLNITLIALKLFTMGSSASTKLVCPKDYDNEKFKTILELFDKLDKNGDRVVESNELKEIANLHVKNRIRLLNESKNTSTENLKLKIADLESKKLQTIAKINREIAMEKRKVNSEHTQFMQNTVAKIQSYEKLDEKEKAEKFLGVVSDKNNHIEFWKFFDYMKNKTDDIQNINF